MVTVHISPSCCLNLIRSRPQHLFCFFLPCFLRRAVSVAYPLSSPLPTSSSPAFRFACKPFTTLLPNPLTLRVSSCSFSAGRFGQQQCPNLRRVGAAPGDELLGPAPAKGRKEDGSVTCRRIDVDHPLNVFVLCPRYLIGGAVNPGYDMHCDTVHFGQQRCGIHALCPCVPNATSGNVEGPCGRLA